MSEKPWDTLTPLAQTPKYSSKSKVVGLTPELPPIQKEAVAPLPPIQEVPEPEIVPTSGQTASPLLEVPPTEVPAVELPVAKKTVEEFLAEEGPSAVQPAETSTSEPVSIDPPKRSVEELLTESPQVESTPSASVPKRMSVEEFLANDGAPSLTGVFDGDVIVTSRAGSSGKDYIGGSRVNRGTDFAGKPGTKVSLPGADEWRIEKARNDVKGRRPEDFSAAQNYGYGNSVEAVNTRTGERIQLSHLQYGSVPTFKEGQILPGGTVIGAIGNTGNTHGKTGYHLDVEYYDKSGKRKDILNSQYKHYFVKQ